MLCILRSLRPCTLQPLQFRRSYAQVADNVPSTSTEAIVQKGVDWRKGRVPVKEDHGLYAFFRRKEGDEKLEGDARFEVVESPESFHRNSGRGWKAEELRLKSFKDLHVLWYVLLRERNLLSTQKEEVRRMGVMMREYQVNATKLYHVRKSMARIKAIVNERRLAYEQAVNLIQTERDTLDNQKVLEHLQEEHRLKTRHARRERELAVQAKAAQTEKMEKERVMVQAKEEQTKEQAKEQAEEQQASPKEIVSQTATAGLFGSS